MVPRRVHPSPRRPIRAAHEEIVPPGLGGHAERAQIRGHELQPVALFHPQLPHLPEHRLADYLKHCALGRVGTFEEVARFAAFLVSDTNTYMSGATIVMDDLTSRRPDPDPVREFWLNHPEIAAMEILTTSATAAIVGARIG